MRCYRDEHQHELAVRRRDAAALSDERARACDSARAKLAMAIRRGTITRDRCSFCSSRDVIAIMPDPAKPFEVRWVCRADRQAARERQRAEQARRVEAAAQSDWERERAATLAAIALLPPAERTQLKTSAARGPGGLRLAAEAPLYTMNLVRLYERYRNAQAGGDAALRAGAGSSETI